MITDSASLCIKLGYMSDFLHKGILIPDRLGYLIILFMKHCYIRKKGINYYDYDLPKNGVMPSLCKVD